MFDMSQTLCKTLYMHHLIQSFNNPMKQILPSLSPSLWVRKLKLEDVKGFA